jgi:hypothetical protein
MPEYTKSYPNQAVYATNRATVGHPTFNVNVNVGTDIGNGTQSESPSGVRSNGMLPFHGEASYASAASGQAFVLYAAGETTPRALAAHEQLMITDYLLVSASGGNVAIGMDANASGTILAKGTVNSGFSKSLQSPAYAPIGVVPKVFCDVGGVDAIINGFILL